MFNRIEESLRNNIYRGSILSQIATAIVLAVVLIAAPIYATAGMISLSLGIDYVTALNSVVLTLFVPAAGFIAYEIIQKVKKNKNA